MRRSIVIILVAVAAVVGVAAAAGVSLWASHRVAIRQSSVPANATPGAPGFRNRNRMPWFGQPGQGNNNGSPMGPGFGGPRRGPFMNPGNPGGMMPRRYWNGQQATPVPATPQGNNGSPSTAPTPVPGNSASQPNGARVTMDAAIQDAQNYLHQQGSNTKLVEVLEFENGFYAAVQEIDSGHAAFELMIDPQTGAVSPEPGANMMWNTQYGHMSGAGSNGQDIGQAAAKSDAQKFLDTSMPGAQVNGDGMAFYGYYTYTYQVNGKIAGLLSVNASTGAVWLHTGYGAFVAEKTL